MDMAKKQKNTEETKKENGIKVNIYHNHKLFFIRKMKFFENYYKYNRNDLILILNII